MAKSVLKTGDDVYFQSDNGLNVFGTVGRVNHKQECLEVIFGDGTQKWAPFRRIRKVGEPEEVNVADIADVLKTKRPTPRVEKTVNSEYTFTPHPVSHQIDEVTCASCGIVKKMNKKSAMPVDTPYYCRRCINKSAASPQGSGIIQIPSSYMTSARRSVGLPHTLANMKGNANGVPIRNNSSHGGSNKSISEECFQCFVFVPENERLTCNLCSRICHLGCLNLCPAPLEGDKFWDVICANCGTQNGKLGSGNNHKKVYSCRRSITSWSDVAHLILSCLMAQHPDEKFFDLDFHIIPFFDSYLENLHLPRAYKNTRAEDRKSHLLMALTNAKLRFMNGREAKKKSSQWSIRSDNYLGLHMGIPSHTVKSVLSPTSSETRVSTVQIDPQKVKNVMLPKGKQQIRHSFPNSMPTSSSYEPDSKKLKQGSSTNDTLAGSNHTFAKPEVMTKMDSHGVVNSMSLNNMFSPELMRKVQANSAHKELVDANGSATGLTKVMLSGQKRPTEVTASSEYFNGMKINKPSSGTSQGTNKTGTSPKGVILAGGAYEGSSRTMGAYKRLMTPPHSVDKSAEQPQLEPPSMSNADQKMSSKRSRAAMESPVHSPPPTQDRAITKSSPITPEKHTTSPGPPNPQHQSYKTPKKESPSPKRAKMLNDLSIFKKLPNGVTVTMKPAHPVPININSVKETLKPIPNTKSKISTKNNIDKSHMMETSDSSASSICTPNRSLDSSPEIKKEIEDPTYKPVGGPKKLSRLGKKSITTEPLKSPIGTLSAVRTRRLKARLNKIKASLATGNIDSENGDDSCSNNSNTAAANNEDSSSLQDFLEYGTSLVSVLPKAPQTLEEKMYNFSQVSKYLREECSSLGRWSLWNNSLREPNPPPFRKGVKDLSILDSYDVVGYCKQANKYLVMWRTSPEDKFSNEWEEDDFLIQEAVTDAEFMASVMDELKTEDTGRNVPVQELNSNKNVTQTNNNNNNNRGDLGCNELKPGSSKPSHNSTPKETTQQSNSVVVKLMSATTNSSSTNCKTCINSMGCDSSSCNKSNTNNKGKISVATPGGGSGSNNGNSCTNSNSKVLLNGQTEKREGGGQDIFVTGLGLRRKSVGVVVNSSCNNNEFSQKSKSSSVVVESPSVDFIDLTSD